jgi:L-ascorbate metabolism protein UlaG (beta-lactamase superfamily)
MKITFLGHACFLIQSPDHTLVTDPFIKENPKAQTDIASLKVDYILLSHAHADHMGDTISIAQASKATVICNAELSGYLSGKGIKTHCMHIGGGFDFPFGRLKMTIAHHGSSVIEDNKVISLGNPCGFLVTISGKTVYFAGDTGLFYDMKLIGETQPIDVALLPIGDNFTMGPEDAVRAVDLLRPEIVIPMHFDTWDIIKQDPHEFAGRVTSPNIRVEVLDIGGDLEI